MSDSLGYRMNAGISAAVIHYWYRAVVRIKSLRDYFSYRNMKLQLCVTFIFLGSQHTLWHLNAHLEATAEWGPTCPESEGSKARIQTHGCPQIMSPMCRHSNPHSPIYINFYIFVASNLAIPHKHIKLGNLTCKQFYSCDREYIYKYSWLWLGIHLDIYTSATVSSLRRLPATIAFTSSGLTGSVDFNIYNRIPP